LFSSLVILTALSCLQSIFAAGIQVPRGVARADAPPSDAHLLEPYLASPLRSSAITPGVNSLNVIRGLLFKRQLTCPGGYGLCPNRRCCPLGSRCCSTGGCCEAGSFCCGTMKCCPTGSTCCTDSIGGCCRPGTVCSSGGVCCPIGQVCTGIAPPPVTIGGPPDTTITTTRTRTSTCTCTSLVDVTLTTATTTSTSPLVTTVNTPKVTTYFFT
jgi:hypothetical protein